MGISCYCMLFITTAFILMHTPAPATSLPAPGHLAIPYYVRQKEERERKETEQLRLRCQSYVESGYYSDPRCEELYLQTFQFSGTAKTVAPSILFGAGCLLAAALLR